MVQLISITKEELMQDIEIIVCKVFERLAQDKGFKEDKKFYTREETAKLLDVSLTTLFHWNNKGVLKATKIGNRVYYSVAEVSAHLNF